MHREQVLGVVRRPFDRPNLTYRVLRRANLHRQLTDILGRHDQESGIVYCSSRREVENLAAWLQQTGLRAPQRSPQIRTLSSR